MPRPSLLRAAAVLGTLALLAGCSGTVSGKHGDRSLPGLGVSGAVGTMPGVRIAAPLDVPRTRSEVVVTGNGPAVQIDQLFVLQLSLYDARTGERVLSTYDGRTAPVVAKSSDDTLFPALTDAIVGQRQGSRIVVALTGADAYGAGGVPPEGVRAEDDLVVVADVVSVPPSKALTLANGKVEGPVADAPQVQTVEDLPVGVLFPGGKRPTATRVVPLITGEGPRVRDHSLVTLHFLGQVWGAGAPYADTYFKEPVVVPIGAEGSAAAWDDALVGVRQGSRVLVIGRAGPPSVATGPRVAENEIVAWVVDVLGVS
ncbi:FKBP-type peptidyl-prolyl cis-trans isomerase [Nocardioides marmoriginsengisoli]|uniref:FKBP-type peptidyl-prolyl cis-trans isomerase n=1 Tax=Nocardioides marmoriginsengisoli TaxID=661483 RepID=UPI0011CDF56D|nr:FKBP-type peptidyl-prolyl cis-trans isomerase [Nocardioides marmoriginsengisoli]